MAESDTVPDLIRKSRKLCRHREWEAAIAVFDEIERRMANVSPAEMRAWRFKPSDYLAHTARLRVKLSQLPVKDRLDFIASQAAMVAPGNFYPVDLVGLVEALMLIARMPEFADRVSRDEVERGFWEVWKAASVGSGRIVSAAASPRVAPDELRGMRDVIIKFRGAAITPPLSPYHWLVISMLMFMAGDLDTGFWARQQALEVTTSPEFAPQDRTGIRLKASGFAERGDENGYRQLLEQHPKAKRDMRFIEMYLGAEPPRRGPPLEGCEEIAAYVEGKTVAMVGPINTGLDNGNEIDGFDIVARMNYRGLSAFSPSAFGTRTDISYYAGGILSRDHDSVVATVGDLKFALFQRGYDTSAYEPFVRCQSMIGIGRSDAPFFAGTPNAFQRYLFELFWYGAKRVKIFNGNLWLDRSPTNPDYHRGAFVKFNVPFVFIRHDIVSNFIFLKRMLERGYIEVDAVLHDILSMDVEHYVREMIATHGTPPGPAS